MGVAVFNTESFESSNVGISLSMELANFYLGYSTNFAAGKGEELDYSSSQTNKTDKLRIYEINIGYTISLKKFSITPLLGFNTESKIYEDPIAFDSYYYGDKERNFSIGVTGSYYFSDHFSVYLGTGTYQIFKTGLRYSLF